MFKDISPDDRSLKEFKTFKQFTFTEADSGSGIFGLEAKYGTFHGFMTGSAESQSYGRLNEESRSLNTPGAWRTWYEHGTFLKVPLYYTIKNLYYQYDNIPNKRSNTTRYPIFTGGNWERKWPHGKPEQNWGSINPRFLGDKCNVITIPQKFFGEEIKPYSVRLLDDSTDKTIEIRDDGYGQLYDWKYSASFAAGTPDSNNSGSCIGNIFYEHGLLTITDTGSFYGNIAIGSSSAGTGTYDGTDGFSLTFQASKTSFEYEYLCHTGEYEFNYSTNPSLVEGRSGSIDIPSGSVYIYNGNLDNPHYEDVASLLLPPASHSYQKEYTSGTYYENFTTSSAFSPYVTNIGLYNEENELLAIAKLSNPIKNDQDLPITFLVRFDA